MSAGAACESGAASGSERLRPLSGVWSLLTRLRRPVSSDSLSSAGSDVTISFAFLSPPPPPHNNPLSRHDPTPLTDSYKKRVQDRNIRRQHDRDLTLHRKYGLIRGDATFDAFSLPHARHSLLLPSEAVTRDRRAASESLPRCAAHVPGKRRAPPPPRPHSALVTTSLTRRHSRKRPAPQPPIQSLNTTKDNTRDNEKENIDININTLVKMKSNKSDQEKRPGSNVETHFKFKTDKNVKKDSEVKVPKMKREKSFLQQIFEGRKRNSALEPPLERILPNISELDKQAAEIIETFRLKPLEQNNKDNATVNNDADAWFCTKCLRKYNSTVVTCLYCLPEQNNIRNKLVANHLSNAKATNVYTQIDSNPSSGPSSSQGNGIAMDEKQKLKEMLREIKDSLPKRSKHDNKEELRSEETINIVVSVSETKSKVIPTKNREADRITGNDKRGSHDASASSKRESYYDPVTLRIGSIAGNEDRNAADPQPYSSKQNVGANQSKAPVINRECRLIKVETEPVKETVVVTQPVVLIGPHPKNHGNFLRNNSDNSDTTIKTDSNNSKIRFLPNDTNKKKIKQYGKSNGHKIEEKGTTGPAISNKPITVSSLLNPIYIPQQSNSQDLRRSFFSHTETQTNTKQNALSTTVLKPTSLSENVIRSAEPRLIKEIYEQPEHTLAKEESSPTRVTKEKTSLQNSASSQKPTTFASVSTSTSNTPLTEKAKISNANMVRISMEQHSKRREWVNQLEQAIATGDELAAAQAAAKLAQLRVACSVLSFSSQIVGESSKNATPTKSKPQNNTVVPQNNENNVSRLKPVESVQSITKVNAAVQSMEIVSPKANIKNPLSQAIGTPSRSIIPQTKPTETIAESPKPNILTDNLHPAPSTSGQSSFNGSTLISINVWVEDRVATRGPVRLWVPRGASYGQLRRRAEAALGLPARLQRWIVGRTLCSDDLMPLAALAGPELNKPFYLCLVEDTGSETANLKTKPILVSNSETSDMATTDVYSELVQLEQQALVQNAEPFECGVCMEECGVGEGAVLRECVHAFCRQCLAETVRHCAEAAVTCPALGCPATLQEREIRAVAPRQAYERWLALGLAAAESGARHAFHCRTRDCAGWALCEPGVRHFPCPVCRRNNCVPCQAIHEGETCEEHRTRLQTAAASLAGVADEDTRALIDDLIAKGEALECPECSAIITKKWGCDWVKCSACKTEICWVTRGRRWGPAGRGDTSAGCRCGVDGKRCHPTCGYCH